MARFYTLKIENIKKDTGKSVVIGFKIPTELKAVYQFKAGQYVTLKAVINNTEIRRDYSICSSTQNPILYVAVKAVEHGQFSNYANSQLKVNDTLEVSKPQGRFVYEPKTETPIIVGFAAGSGITPILSIIKSVLENTKGSFILMYGNKTTDDAMFYDDLLRLKNTYKKRFKLHFIFSQTIESNALFGRIDKSIVNYIIKNKYANLTVDAFYICGPEIMTREICAVLEDNAINTDRVFYELFTVSTSSKTRNAVDASNKNITITVIVDEESTAFEMKPNQSILEAALKAKIDVPYSCQGGVCSTCIARLKEGEAKLQQNNVLTDSELEEGLVLTCQAHPTTSTVIVDYDDV